MRALRIWLTATLVVCLWSGAGTAGAADLQVERARADLRAARAAAEEVATDLDRAVAAYEQARSHSERLAAEALDTRRTTVEARDAAVRADDVVQQRLMMLFKHPELATQAWAPGALSGSVGETLHRVELIEQLTQLGARDRGRAERALGRVRDAEHDYRVVTAGVRDAVRRQRARTADLSAALHRALGQVEAARDDVRTAQAAAAADRGHRQHGQRPFDSTAPALAVPPRWWRAGQPVPAGAGAVSRVTGR